MSKYFYWQSFFQNAGLYPKIHWAHKYTLWQLRFTQSSDTATCLVDFYSVPTNRHFWIELKYTEYMYHSHLLDVLTNNNSVLFLMFWRWFPLRSLTNFFNNQNHVVTGNKHLTGSSVVWTKMFPSEMFTNKWLCLNTARAIFSVVVTNWPGGSEHFQLFPFWKKKSRKKSVYDKNRTLCM